MSTSAVSPVRLDLDAPLEVANWRPLLHGILAIPHAIVLYFLGLAVGVVMFIAFFAILFTGAYPQGMFDFAAKVMAYQWRVTSYTLWLRESYPAFGIDDQYDPATLEIEYPTGLSRGLIFVKWLLIIPHCITLMIFGIGAYVMLIVGFFTVLFTGKWPEGARAYVIRFMRWSTQIQVYVSLMSDAYPPFTPQD